MFELVYAWPIPDGNTPLVREAFSEKKAKEQDPLYNAQLAAYRKEMGWENSDFWLQHVEEKDYLVIHITGGHPNDDYAGTFLKRYNDGCPIAKRVRERHLNLFNSDPCDPQNFPQLEPLFQNLTKEEENSSRYAFVRPLVSGGAEKLRAFYADLEKNEEKKARYKGTLLSLGIVDYSNWIQSSKQGGDYVVTSQRIIEPLSDARSGYLQGLRDNEMIQEVSALFSEATGLDPEALLPDLEPLLVKKEPCLA